MTRLRLSFAALGVGTIVFAASCSSSPPQTTATGTAVPAITAATSPPQTSGRTGTTRSSGTTVAGTALGPPGTTADAQLDTSKACSYISAEEVGKALGLQIASSEGDESRVLGLTDCKYKTASTYTSTAPGGTADVEWTDGPASDFDAEVQVLQGSNAESIPDLGDSALWKSSDTDKEIFVITSTGRFKIDFGGRAGASDDDVKAAMIDLAREAITKTG